jgi:hypothetical protein
MTAASLLCAALCFGNRICERNREIVIISALKEHQERHLHDAISTTKIDFSEGSPAPYQQSG